MVTLKELASILHVSPSTVSKALNNSPEISDKTKKRIVELANELNYRPNRIAQRLKSNKNHTVGVIIPNVLNPFFAEALHGIEKEAEEQKFDIIVCLSNEQLDKEIRSVDLLSSGSVDGFIIAVGQESQVQEYREHLVKLRAQNMPLVLFDRSLKSFEGNYILVDDYQSVFDATTFLIEKEKRLNIVLFSNIEDLSVGEARIKGYEDAMAQNALDTKILKLGHVQDVDKAIKTFLTLNSTVDAIISIDHLTGIIALNTLKEIKRQVPQDISVIGFGSPETQILTNPKLTVVYQKAEVMGRESMLVLKDLMQPNLSMDSRIQKKVIKSQLLKGGTTMSS